MVGNNIFKEVLHTFYLFVYLIISSIFLFSFSKKWRICQYLHIYLIFNSIQAVTSPPAALNVPCYLSAHSANVPARRNGGRVAAAQSHSNKGSVAQLQRLGNAITK